MRAQRQGSACESTNIGQVCNWGEVGLGGTADHLVRDYSLQALLDESKSSFSEALLSWSVFLVFLFHFLLWWLLMLWGFGEGEPWLVARD